MALIIAFNPKNSKAAGKTSGPCKIIAFPTREPARPKATPAPPKPRKRGGSAGAEQRNAMLCKIHMAISELSQKLEHFDKDFYHDELERCYGLSAKFGRVSSADLDRSQRHNILMWLSSLGFNGKQGKHRQAAPATFFADEQGRRPRMEKIEAMLAEKGRAEGTDLPWGYAVSILKRQTGSLVKRFEDATAKQLDAVIAALYRDARRKGRRTG